MNTSNISQINKALLVLKNFVELSATLLPYLDQLKEKRSITPTEQLELESIKSVFTDQEIDEQASILLLHSDIIGLIKSSFKAINDKDPDSDRKGAVNYYLSRFKKEYLRLRENWQKIELN
ncbi:hypothetical protein [Lishizhenia sp.]|uniref:hypothetical protein n=1 Tax=Lishizhenia sp. TaxID=2497594 RepID=UPI00299F2D8B|nr:hypothetical protein [Lishizhenia sp.]MDX1445989.1 hypothetical protein [Lishizhenia sp.]